MWPHPSPVLPEGESDNRERERKNLEGKEALRGRRQDRKKTARAH